MRHLQEPFNLPSPLGVSNSTNGTSSGSGNTLVIAPTVPRQPLGSPAGASAQPTYLLSGPAFVSPRTGVQYSTLVASLQSAAVAVNVDAPSLELQDLELHTSITVTGIANQAATAVGVDNSRLVAALRSFLAKSVLDIDPVRVQLQDPTFPESGWGVAINLTGFVADALATATTPAATPGGSVVTPAVIRAAVQAVNRAAAELRQTDAQGRFVDALSPYLCDALESCLPLTVAMNPLAVVAIAVVPAGVLVPPSPPSWDASPPPAQPGQSPPAPEAEPGQAPPMPASTTTDGATPAPSPGSPPPPPPGTPPGVPAVVATDASPPPPAAPVVPPTVVTLSVTIGGVTDPQDLDLATLTAALEQGASDTVTKAGGPQPQEVVSILDVPISASLTLRSSARLGALSAGQRTAFTAGLAQMLGLDASRVAINRVGPSPAGGRLHLMAASGGLVVDFTVSGFGADTASAAAVMTALSSGAAAPAGPLAAALQAAGMQGLSLVLISPPVASIKASITLRFSSAQEAAQVDSFVLADVDAILLAAVQEVDPRLVVAGTTLVDSAVNFPPPAPGSPSPAGQATTDTSANVASPPPPSPAPPGTPVASSLPPSPLPPSPSPPPGTPQASPPPPSPPPPSPSPPSPSPPPGTPLSSPPPPSPPNSPPSPSPPGTPVASPPSPSPSPPNPSSPPGTPAASPPPPSPPPSPPSSSPPKPPSPSPPIPPAASPPPSPSPPTVDRFVADSSSVTLGLSFSGVTDPGALDLSSLTAALSAGAIATAQGGSSAASTGGGSAADAAAPTAVVTIVDIPVTASITLNGFTGTSLTPDQSVAVIAGLAQSLGVDPSRVTILVGDSSSVAAQKSAILASETRMATRAANIGVTLQRAAVAALSGGRRRLHSGLAVTFMVTGFGANNTAAASAITAINAVASNPTSPVVQQLAATGVTVTVAIAEAPSASIAVAITLVYSSPAAAAAGQAAVTAAISSDPTSGNSTSGGSGSVTSSFMSALAAVAPQLQLAAVQLPSPVPVAPAAPGMPGSSPPPASAGSVGTPVSAATPPSAAGTPSGRPPVTGASPPPSGSGATPGGVTTPSATTGGLPGMGGTGTVSGSKSSPSATSGINGVIVAVSVSAGAIIILVAGYIAYRIQRKDRLAREAAANRLIQALGTGEVPIKGGRRGGPSGGVAVPNASRRGLLGMGGRSRIAPTDMPDEDDHDAQQAGASRFAQLDPYAARLQQMLALAADAADGDAAGHPGRGGGSDDVRSIRISTGAYALERHTQATQQAGGRPATAPHGRASVAAGARPMSANLIDFMDPPAAAPSPRPSAIWQAAEATLQAVAPYMPTRAQLLLGFAEQADPDGVAAAQAAHPGTEPGYDVVHHSDAVPALPPRRTSTLGTTMIDGIVVDLDHQQAGPAQPRRISPRNSARASEEKHDDETMPLVSPVRNVRSRRFSSTGGQHL